MHMAYSSTLKMDQHVPLKHQLITLHNITENKTHNKIYLQLYYQFET
jgi:hypothetical protein